MRIIPLSLRAKLGLPPPKGAIVCPYCWYEDGRSAAVFITRDIVDTELNQRRPTLVNGKINQKSDETPVLYDCDNHTFWSARSPELEEANKKYNDYQKSQQKPSSGKGTWFTLSPSSMTASAVLTNVNPLANQATGVPDDVASNHSDADINAPTPDEPEEK